MMTTILAARDVVMLVSGASSVTGPAPGDPPRR